MKRARLNKLLEEVPDTTESPNNLFANIDDDYWYWLNTEGYRSNSDLRKILPSMPAGDIQVKITGSEGDATLYEGFRAYQLFKRLFEENVGKLAACKSVLDFGCGWGRIIRFFLKDLEPSKLVGIDNGAYLIEVCKETNRWCHFEATTTLPPTPFVENSFDLIYCYSVFSHLSEDVHKKWLTELRRILQPGGLLIATTWPREFIERCDAARKNQNFAYLPSRRSGHNSRWENTLASLFLDTHQTLTNYDNGTFCFAEYDRQEFPQRFIEETSYYGEACIPKGYVLDQWTEHFTYVDFINDRNQCPQNVIIAKK